MDVNQKLYGPILPPVSNDTINSTSIGINIPTNETLGPQLPLHMQNITSNYKNEHIIGPTPTDATEITDVESMLSKRALQIKLKNIEGGTDTNMTDITREEWMLELPEIQKKNLLNLPRSFRTKEQPDFSDRSCWTDIANNTKKITQEEVYQKKLSAEIKKNQDMLVNNHKKKEQKGKSLLKLHQEERKKKSKKKQIKTERRPFIREFDLQNKPVLDHTKKTAIVKNAQVIDTKFSFGKTKYL